MGLDLYSDELSRVLRYSAHSEEAAFHRAIVENLHDETPIRVYSDWLEDTGRPGMAALVRKHLQHRPYAIEYEQQAFERDRPIAERIAAEYGGEVTPPPPATVANVHSYPHPEMLHNLGRATITDDTGGLRWLSLAHQSEAHPHLWFHWLTGAMRSAEAEDIARQLAYEGVPVEGDPSGAADFLATEAA